MATMTFSAQPATKPSNPARRELTLNDSQDNRNGYVFGPSRYKNHEKSKKHKEKLALLKELLRGRRNGG